MSCSRCSSWVRALGLGLLLSTVSVHGALGTASGPGAASRAPLADAAERMDRARIRALLKQARRRERAQVDGMTALHWAAYTTICETAELLVRAGANVKAANRYGVTPLSLACTNGNGAIVELLLKAGADPNAPLPGGETPLMTAARTGALAGGEGAAVARRERRRQG